MLKRFAFVAILLAAAGPLAQAQTTGRSLAISSGDQGPARQVPTDMSRKTWFDRAVTDILEGRVDDPGATTPPDPDSR